MKGVKIYVFSLVFLFTLALASSAACDPKISLLNQDPYPATPGEYVKLVFQVDGLDNPDCGDFNFELLNKYPLVFNPGEKTQKFFSKINYIKDYQTNLQIPYEVRVDEAALDGANFIEVKSQVANKAAILTNFSLEVKNVKGVFESTIKDYNYKTHEIIIEVLNVGESNIKALTVEIPKQDSMIIKGSNRAIVGDLDSNEYTTASFEAIPSDGSIDINLVYSDSINVRRTEHQKITFDSTYFTNRIADQKTTSSGTYVFYAIIVIVIVWFIIRKIFKKKKK